MVAQALACIRGWEEDAEGPSKLIYPLSHRYTTRSLSFNVLKGQDKHVGRILAEAAKLSDEVVAVLGVISRRERSYDQFDENGHLRRGESSREGGGLVMEHLVDSKGKEVEATVPMQLVLSQELLGGEDDLWDGDDERAIKVCPASQSTRESPFLAPSILDHIRSQW